MGVLLGSLLPHVAAKSGAKVILFEKDEAIAQNIRTSGVTWIDEIEKLGIHKEYYNPIKKYSFFSPSNEVTIGGTIARSNAYKC